MKRLMILAAVALVAVMGYASTGSADEFSVKPLDEKAVTENGRGRRHHRRGGGGGHFWIGGGGYGPRYHGPRYYRGGPRYYAPPPVYYAPPPVMYVQPAPVYTYPGTVYCQ